MNWIEEVDAIIKGNEKKDPSFYSDPNKPVLPTPDLGIVGVLGKTTDYRAYKPEGRQYQNGIAPKTWDRPIRCNVCGDEGMLSLKRWNDGAITVRLHDDTHDGEWIVTDL